MAVVTKVEYPEKLYYKINEVSRITGLKPYVLRYWETEFDQLKPQKDVNDQRRYRKADIDVIQRIKRLLYEERFTIAGAKKRLRFTSRSEQREEQLTRQSKIKAISKELGGIRKELTALLQRYA
ncbi:MerR family transcriptional regulator [Candidatus Sumerlaeota bacterium]|nr:MerR family transcriptional regulator [Candidatus Sumerlaeota bacterium]